MSLLHAHYALRNQQAFQRLIEGISKPPPHSSSHSSHNHSHNQHNTGTSSSGGRSWNRPSILSGVQGHGHGLDVNARDWLGRTVLHLACSATDRASVEYVRLLLGCPGINVNVQDVENRWTALHRALYNGNIEAAILLLQRSDIDTNLTDWEGYRAFDLYNTTVEDTKPPRDIGSAELFTWGTNRNAALGHNDSDDRTYPEQVLIRPKPSHNSKSSHNSGSDAAQGQGEAKGLKLMLKSAAVKEVVMARLHTVIVTDEPRGNLRVCGFASSGRLGPTPAQHSLYTPTPLPSLEHHKIISVALGQDHTLALTEAGSVLSWGLNRFSQLGYVVEGPVSNAGGGKVGTGTGTGVGGAGGMGGGSGGAGGAGDEVQMTPRAIAGSLKREVVRGVAACKTASACWTGEGVWTWGRNGGQLGYDKATQPVQVSPRLVTKVTRPVIGIALTDSAMACLLVTKDVVLLWNDGLSKINFPAQGFPSEIQAYRPPQAVNNAAIAKVVCSSGGGENLFAAVSENGEIFTFGPTDSGSSGGGGGGGEEREKEREREKEKVATVRPQRVWALRKQWSAVRDAALGADGTIIICTESGHVFVRSRNLKAAPSLPNLNLNLTAPPSLSSLSSLSFSSHASPFSAPFHTTLPSSSSNSNSNKPFKFHRVPYIQRVVAVGANDTGALSALRSEFRGERIGLDDGYQEGTGTGMRSGRGGRRGIERDLERVRPWVAFEDPEGDGERVEPGILERTVRKEGMGMAEGTMKVGGVKQGEGVQETLEGPVEEEEEAEEVGVEEDVKGLEELWRVVAKDEVKRKQEGGDGKGLFADRNIWAHGADLGVLVKWRGGEFEFPVHRVLMAARSEPLTGLLDGRVERLRDKETGISMNVQGPSAKSLLVSGCHPFSVLILAHYIYSDQLLAIWDNRVSRRMQPLLSSGGGSKAVQAAQVTKELRGLARLMGLEKAEEALRRAAKYVPEGTMVRDMSRLFRASQLSSAATTTTTTGPASTGILKPDVVLRLADREVCCQSVVLRARTPFFEAFFGEEEWTRERWEGDDEGADGGKVLRIELGHLRWRAMEYVVRFMVCGEEEGMFDGLDFIETVDNLLDFMFEVMSAANELLLDRLLLICSSIILNYVTVHNVCSILADFSFLDCTPLMDRLHRYIAVNMETLLESRMLDDLTPRLIRSIASSVRHHQQLKLPVSRSDLLANQAMQKPEIARWLAEQDIPKPIVRTARQEREVNAKMAMSPKLSPKRSRKASGPSSPMSSPLVRPAQKTASGPPPQGDDLFAMDDADFVPALNLGADAPNTGPNVQTVVAESGVLPAVSGSPGKAGPWKAKSAGPRVDMKAILAAEEEESRHAQLRHASSSAQLVKGKASASREDMKRTPVDPVPGSSVPGPSTGPWRATMAPTGNVPFGPPLGQVVNTPPRESMLQVRIKESPRGSPSPSMNIAPGPATPTRASGMGSSRPSLVSVQPSIPGLGPVITPSRQAPSKPSKSGLAISRQASTVGSNSAWTLPPVQPIVEPTPSASQAPMSFAAIQQLQLEQGVAPVKDKRSLKEIQEEERARQAEEDFLKWWAEEEERVRVENEEIAALVSEQGQGQGQRRGQVAGSRGKKPKKPRGEGKGRPSQSNGQNGEQPAEASRTGADAGAAGSSKGTRGDGRRQGSQQQQQQQPQGQPKRPTGSNRKASSNAKNVPRSNANP